MTALVGRTWCHQKREPPGVATGRGSGQKAFSIWDMGWVGEPSKGSHVLRQVSYKQEETGWIALIRMSSYSGGYSMDGAPTGLFAFIPPSTHPGPFTHPFNPSISILHQLSLPSIPFIRLTVRQLSRPLSHCYPPATLTPIFWILVAHLPVGVLKNESHN